MTYAGDENSPVQPADQSWMKKTDTVAVFSDDVRNNLKSGYQMRDNQPLSPMENERLRLSLRISSHNQPTLRQIAQEMSSNILRPMIT